MPVNVKLFLEIAVSRTNSTECLEATRVPWGEDNQAEGELENRRKGKRWPKWLKYLRRKVYFFLEQSEEQSL